VSKIEKGLGLWEFQESPEGEKVPSEDSSVLREIFSRSLPQKFAIYAFSAKFFG
jgi:hypothetical protein